MPTYPFINKNGKYHHQSKEWSDTRAEIMQLKRQLNITDDDFRMLSPYENHQGIIEKVYQTFCNLTGKNRPVWLWDNCKQNKYSINTEPNLPEIYLDRLIDNDGKIWLGLSDSHDGKDKIWLYEGNILAIQKILAEMCFYDEFYFIPKKYEWLICINHHDCLIATGGDMRQKLEALHTQIVQNDK